MPNQRRPGWTSRGVAGWVPIAEGFLCDPAYAAGSHVVENDGVLYWETASDGQEYVINLSPEATAEAARRNGEVDA